MTTDTPVIEVTELAAKKLVEVLAEQDKVGNMLRVMVMPGPGDLAASLGLPGELTHSRVAAEIDRIVTTVQARSNCGIAAYANSVAEGAAWHKRGARLSAYSIDYKIFGAALRDIRQAMPD